MSSETLKSCITLIPDVCIHELSGPVMLKIMYPLSSSSLPIVVLLGDRHGIDELCEKCENDQGCYKVFDPKFLKQIDRIGEKYPVDFFTESSHYHFQISHAQNKNQILFHQFLNQLENCHDTSMRGKDTDCPTKYVRWHRMDTRMDPKSPEYDLLVASKVMDLLSNRLKDVQDSVSLLDMFTTWNDNDFTLPVSHFITNFLYIINDMDSLIKYVWNYVNKSVIFKQIRRMKENPNEYYSVFSERIKSWIGDKIRKPITEYRLLLLDIFGNPFQEISVTTLDKLKSKTGQQAIVDLRDVFLDFANVCVDLYTFTRMMKLPQNNDRALLAFCYFGQRHCLNLEKFLRTRGYTEVFSTRAQSGEPYNCLKIPYSYDLYTMVIELAKKRYSENPQLLQQYKQKLRLEHANSQPSEQSEEEKKDESVESTSVVLSEQTNEEKGENDQTAYVYILCALLIIANIITVMFWLHHRKLADAKDASAEQLEVANRWKLASIICIVVTIVLSLVIPLVLKFDSRIKWIPNTFFVPVLLVVIGSALLIFAVWSVGGLITGFTFW